MNAQPTQSESTINVNLVNTGADSTLDSRQSRLGEGELVFDSISKSFGGTKALENVSLSVKCGEIVALLGENGAGKSTLIKVLGGIHQADSGQVTINGVPYQHKPGATNVQQGVAFIHQDLGLIEWMSIAENMALAQGFRKGSSKLIDWKACEEMTQEALARVGCDFSPTQRVSTLTRAEKSLVAIARALAVKCQFLVLDEPTASLPLSDVRLLFDVLKQLRAEGVGMIFVSHRLDEIFAIADRVVVLRDGNLAGVAEVASTSAEQLVDMIVGHKPKTFSKPVSEKSQIVLEIKQLSTDSMGPIDFTLRAKEILGLVGLRGAGQEEVGRCIFGSAEYSGEVKLLGQPHRTQSAGEAMRSGVGLIPRDRLVESVVPSLSIRENMFINPSAIGRKLFSFMGYKQETALALEIGESVGLKPNDPDLPIEALSGGNQQKVIVGRWLQNDNKVLIAEDPTAGVDVGAKAEIYTLLSEMLKEDVAVIVISTDFEEVANICDRAVVFSRGKVIGELTGEALTMESLVQTASASEVSAD